MTTKSERIHEAMTEAGIAYHRVVYDEQTYIVTTGTGETCYGRDGEMAFAYCEEDVEGWAVAAEDDTGAELTYDSFCDYLYPETDRDLALHLAARYQERLTYGGACSPVLTDEEYWETGEPVES